MTMLDEPPAVAAAADPPRSVPIVAASSSWRLAMRLARRETRRRPGRTALASLLIAVPVMAMTIGSVVARSESGDWSAQFARRYGDADIAVDRSRVAFSDEQRPAALPPGTEVTDYLWVNTAVDGGDGTGFIYGTVTDIDLADPATGSPIEVVDGRIPRVGEIMLPPDLADSLGVSIGDEIAFERPSGTWTLSGIGRMRDSYYTDAIVIPGFDRGRIADGSEQTVALYHVPDGTSLSSVEQLAGELGGVTRLTDPFGGPTDIREAWRGAGSRARWHWSPSASSWRQPSRRALAGNSSRSVSSPRTVRRPGSSGGRSRCREPGPVWSEQSSASRQVSPRCRSCGRSWSNGSCSTTSHRSGSTSSTSP